MLAWLAEKKRLDKLEKESAEARRRFRELCIAVRDLFPRGESLTSREREVLDGILRKKQNKEIAEELHVSVSTVKFHVSSLLVKLGRTNRHELTEYDVTAIGTMPDKGEKP